MDTNVKKRSPRTTALKALLQMERNDGYSNLVLDQALSAAQLNDRDNALCSAIFYGVLERRLTLDYYIYQCLREPAKKPEPAAMWALRCGAYQILYLDRVPDSAAVNETVNALKAIGKAKLAGFVNGVLRGLVRKKAQLSLPAGDGMRALSLRYSVPEELIRLWQKSYGREISQRLLECLNGRPRLYIRVNTAKCTADELCERLAEENVICTPLPMPEGAAVLENCGAPGQLRAFRDGLFHVQDLSSQLVCRILGPQPGETICDCCAAPGGKTFIMAQMVGDSGAVYSADLYESRVRLIQAGAERLGLRRVRAWVNDAEKGFNGMPQVDRMLCDVPCSGFGVIRRKPEIRYRGLDSIQDLPRLQYAILRQASKQVKPGGVLVYSTCTLNPAENQAVAERFLQENNGFSPMKIEVGLERWADEPEHMLTMAPFSGASDGFFAAAFRRISG